MTRVTIRAPWLFAGELLGHYDLPEEMLAAYATHEALQRHAIPEAAPADGVQRAAQRLLQAARAGEELLVRVDEVAVREDRESALLASQALAQARDEATGDVNDLVFDLRDTLITDHLQPAYADVIGQARELGPVVAGVGADVVSIASADAKTRAAVVAFDGLVDRYSSLRGTWSRLFGMPESTGFPDLAALWSEVRNTDSPDVWPGWSPNFRGHHVAQAPWAGDHRTRLLWIASTTAAQVWCPTPAALDALVAEKYAAGLAAQAHARAASAAVHAWGAG